MSTLDRFSVQGGGEIEYPISQIVFGQRLREVRNQEKVASIAASMEQVGLINAVVLLPDGVLVAGAHRVAAAKLLGWTTIRSIIKEIDELDARLMEIDENLHRQELDVLEQGEHIREREEILRAKGRRAEIGGQPGNQNASENECRTVLHSFVTSEDIGEMMGLSRDSVQKRKRIAEGIAPEVKDSIRGTDLANSTTQLLDLARMEPEAQKAAVDLIRTGAAETVGQAKTLLSQPIPTRPHVSHNSGDNEWYTPAEYIDAAYEVMGEIHLDPASSARANEIVEANEYFDAERNGLEQPWGGCVWMNPPYAAELIGKFCAKFAQHVRSGEIEQGIVLVNNATETEWFSTLVGVCTAVVFPRGRVRFWQPSGVLGAPLQGQAVLYAGSNGEKFLEVFRGFGWGTQL